MKILIADDEPLVREGFRHIIKNSHIPSYNLLEATTGSEAIKLAKEQSPDIGIIDIKMPGISGLDAIREIRAFSPHMKFIILSAYDSFEYSQAAIRYGVSDFLVKPVNPSQLIAAICRCINTKSQGPAGRHDAKKVKSAKAKALFLNREYFASSIMAGHSSRSCYIAKNLLEMIRPTSVEALRLEAIELILFAYKTALARGAAASSLQQPCYRTVKAILFTDADDEILDLYKETIHTIVQAVPVSGSASTRQLVEQADRFIKESINDNLTLNSVARQVYLSPAYFCTIFKKHKGQSFSAYINNLRVQLAKELLADDSLSIHNIASRVGFTSTSYFSKVFKCSTGMSPGMYRKNNLVSSSK